jgi:hypothetical protein
LKLNEFDASQLAVQDASKRKQRSSSFLVSGLVDLDASLNHHSGRTVANAQVNLKNASLLLPDKQPLAQSVSGGVTLKDDVIQLSKVGGQLLSKTGGSGSFQLDGSVSTRRQGGLDIQFSGKHVDLGQLLAFFKSVNLPVSPQLAQTMKGTARELSIKLKGKVEAPVVMVAMTPEDVYCQMAPTTKPVHLTAGSIILDRDQLTLKDVSGSTSTGKFVVSSLTDNFLDNPKILNFKIKTNAMDAAEVQQYLRSETVPADIRSYFAQSIKPLNPVVAGGKIFCDLTVNFAASPAAVDGQIGFYNLAGKLGDGGLPFERSSGVVSFAGKNLQFENLIVNTAGSSLNIDGAVDDYRLAPAWQVSIKGNLKPQEALLMWPAAGKNFNLSADSRQAVAINANVAGKGSKLAASFTGSCPLNGNVALKGNFGALSQPKMPVRFDGSLLFVDGTESRLEFQSCHLFLGDAAVQGSGKCTFRKDGGAKPNLEFVVTTPDPVALETVMGALHPELDNSGVKGTLKGTLAMAGPVDNLLTHGEVVFNQVALPTLNIRELTGKIDTPRWSIIGDDIADRSGLRSEARLNFPVVNVGGLIMSDVQAAIVFDNAATARLSLNDGVANVAGGKMNVSGWFEPKSTSSHIELTLSKLAVDEFITDLVEHSGEVTGLLDGGVKIDSSGTTYLQLVGNMQGLGDFAIHSGSVPKFAQLQEKLNHANLLHQGIFGFNFNNLLQSFVPVKLGQFKEASGQFQIKDGVVALEQLRFDGSDMRLRAAGNWNIPRNTVSLDVAGDIPRVSSSILSGAMGEVSRDLTLQKAVRVMTFNKLGSLPSFPILGDIGSDDPRAFSFKVVAALTTPNAVAQSIEKSFKWLPNKPNASAHPLPGIQM